MSALSFFISSLFFYANSKHFPQQPAWFNRISGSKTINTALATIGLLVGVTLEIRSFGWSTGLLTSLFWMGLLLSVLILFLPFSKRSLAFLSLLVVFVSLIKAFI